MAIFTLQELDEQIAAYKEALLALAVNQSYKLGRREYVRADLPEIRNWIILIGRGASCNTVPVRSLLSGGRAFNVKIPIYRA